MAKPRILCIYPTRLINLIMHENSCKILYLSYDVASGSEITPCNKIDKPLVVYRFTGNVITSVHITCNDKRITFLRQK